MLDSDAKKCPYCGNNPVPHLLTWYNESLSILLTPFRRRLLYNRLTRRAKERGWGQKFALFLTRFLERLRVLSRQSNPELCKVARAKVLWEEAEKRGIRFQELLLFGRPFDTYIAERGGRVQDAGCRVQGTEDRENSNPTPHPSTLVFSGLPRPLGYHNSVLDVMDDKWYLKKRFLDAGLPVPAGAAVTTFYGARKIFRLVNKPAILKPRTGSRGRHSTTFVCSEQELAEAYRAAKQLCHWVMVEEQLKGPVYRATVINFKLVGVLRGDPPQVLGDGRLSIGELIDQKNARPHPGVKDIVVDSTVELFLSRQGLSLASVLPSGQKADLSEKIGVNYGGSSAEEIQICHPDNQELFMKAARVVGDPIVGFDFIIGDITKSWKKQRCGFIEANSLPFINLHHDPLHGKPRNAAAAVWEMLGW